EELLLAGVDQLHGPPGLAREQRADDRRVVVAGLAAEAAADLGLDHADLRFRDPERDGVAAAREIGRLGVAPHRDAIALPLRDAADRLQRRVPLTHRLPG